MREGSSPVGLGRAGFRAALGFAVFDATSAAVLVVRAGVVAGTGGVANPGALIGALVVLAICAAPLVFLLRGECTRNFFLLFGILTTVVAVTCVNVLIHVLVAPRSFFGWMLVASLAAATIGLAGNLLLWQTLNGDRSDGQPSGVAGSGEV